VKLTQEKKTELIKEFQAGNFKTKQLAKKYNLTTAYIYQIASRLKKQNQATKTDISASRKKAWETRRANAANTEKTAKAIEVTNRPVSDYRTVYFKDFSVQIHKKALARLVVDHRNNLHILNA
jgi:hypothetical protein